MCLLSDSRTSEQLQAKNHERFDRSMQYNKQIIRFMLDYDNKLEQLNQLANEFIDCLQRKEAVKKSMDEWHNQIKVELQSLAEDFYTKAKSLKKAISNRR